MRRFNLPFQVAKKTVEQFANKEPKFGFHGLGKVIFLQKYSRPVDEEGTKETYTQTSARVVSGMMSLVKEQYERIGKRFDDAEHQELAKEFMDAMHKLTILPPGRGLWAMGTEVVHRPDKRLSAALFNCSFISTGGMHKFKDIHGEWNPSRPFEYVMDVCMLGVGVGFDTIGSYDNLPIYHKRKNKYITYKVSDDREGWVYSLRLLLEEYFIADAPAVVFDYSAIRPAGTPLKTFGGVCAGYAPLKNLHDWIRKYLCGTDVLDSLAIVDIMNIIGVCVGQGGIRYVI
jgi:ribonucleoside-triphosphate reductase